MGINLGDLRLKLLEAVPVMLEMHFSSIATQRKEYEQFIETNKPFLHSGFEIILKGLIESLFMNSEDYHEYLGTMEQEGYEQGVVTVQLLGQNVTFAMELSKDLHLQVQKTIYTLIEESEADTVSRLCLFSRMLECDWTRFVGFVRGYIATKDEKIDYLHSQKISVMGQMAAGMAHEIRNPLSSIKGFAQLIKYKLQANIHEINVNDLIQYLDLSINEIDSINGLVSDFLLLARKNEGSKNKEAVISVKQVVDKVSSLTRHMMIEKNITLQADIPKDGLYVKGTASQLEQVFLNIIKNSVDALKDGGIIRIDVESDPADQQVVIRFTDNGIGMPQEIMDKIFDPFFTTKESGTGIGLAICKQIIENHNGSISIESDAGQGTTVRIALPPCTPPL